MLRAGTCISTKPLNDELQPVKSCPECREPILGLQRYGRVSNKRVLDLLDRKFLKSNRLELQQAEARLADVYVADADQAARNGDLTEKALRPMYKVFQGIIKRSKRSPSTQVRSPEICEEIVALECPCLTLPHASKCSNRLVEGSLALAQLACLADLQQQHLPTTSFPILISPAGYGHVRLRRASKSLSSGQCWRRSCMPCRDNSAETLKLATVSLNLQCICIRGY